MVPTLLLTGALAGALGRHVLKRLRRGATMRAGWCEASTAILWCLVGLANVPSWWLPVMLTFSWLAVMLTATDLVHGRLPDALTLPSYPLFAVLLIVAATTGPNPHIIAHAAIGATLFLTLHATVHYIAPQAMGGGDVKLSGTLGAILGAVSWLALTAALVLASLITLCLHVISPGRYREKVPHGPGLLAATWLLALLSAR